MFDEHEMGQNTARRLSTTQRTTNVRNLHNAMCTELAS